MKGTTTGMSLTCLHVQLVQVVERILETLLFLETSIFGRLRVVVCHGGYRGCAPVLAQRRVLGVQAARTARF